MFADKKFKTVYSASNLLRFLNDGKPYINTFCAKGKRNPKT